MEVLNVKEHRPLLSKSDNTFENLPWDNQKVVFKFYETHTGAVVHVNSSLLNENNYRLTLKEFTLSLIVYERREIVKPTFIEVIHKTIAHKSAYERLKSFKYRLPQSNLSIERTIWNKERKRLEIILTKQNG